MSTSLYIDLKKHGQKLFSQIKIRSSEIKYSFEKKIMKYRQKFIYNKHVWKVNQNLKLLKVAIYIFKLTCIVLYISQFLDFCNIIQLDK